MALLFAVCPVCVERHALRADGRMSIHSTAVGARCSGEAEAKEPATSKRLKPAQPKKGAVPPHLSGRHLTPRQLARLTPFEAEERRQDLKRRVREDQKSKLAEQGPDMDPARRAAYAIASAPRRGPDPGKRPAATVYVTKTTRLVSGGLPTLGKRAR